MKEFKYVIIGRLVKSVCKRHDGVCGNHAEIYRQV